jgi:hypothetical protein
MALQVKLQMNTVLVMLGTAIVLVTSWLRAHARTQQRA